MNWDTEQQERAYNDFRVFLFIVWHEIGLPDPTPVQNDIALTLMNPPNDRIIIEGFRGIAKSFITCAYSCWTLWRNPQHKILIVSASRDRADANANFVKRILQTVPFLTYLLPKRHQRDTQNVFDVSPALPDASPSVKSVGITGQITGSRADLLVSDDVEVPNNSGTQTQRDKLSEAVREYDAILKPKGRIVYLGTPQNEMSIYNELQKRGYTSIVYPVVFPATPDERKQYGDTLSPYLAKKYDANPEVYANYPTDPARFDEEEIAKRRLSYGKAGFALQFLLNTNLSDAEKYPLKVSDLIVADLDSVESSIKWVWSNGNQERLNDVPSVALKGDFFYTYLTRSQEVLPYQSTCMFVDPSGRGNDETAYAVFKFLNGYLFLLEVGGYKEGYETTVLKGLATKCKYWGVQGCYVEPNFGNGMFAKLLIPVMQELCPGCAVEDAKSAKGQKEARIIDTLEPVMMRHKLIIDTNVVTSDYRVYEKDPQYSLVYQMTRLSRDRGSLAHDDRIEVVSMGVEHFVDMMSVNEQQGYDEIAFDQLEKWLDPDYGIFYKEETPRQLNERLLKEKGSSFPMKNISVFEHYPCKF